MAGAELTPRDGAPKDGEKPRRRRLRVSAADLRLVGVAIVAVYGVVFVALNTHRTKVNFVFGSTRVSVIWVILLSLALGLVLAVPLLQLRRHRRARKH